MSEEPRAIRGGFHLKDLPPFKGQERCVHALQMTYDWDLVRSVGKCDHVSSGYDRGWCYEGTGLETLHRVVAQARLWDGSDHTEPEGWIRAIPPLEW